MELFEVFEDVVRGILLKGLGDEPKAHRPLYIIILLAGVILVRNIDGFSQCCVGNKMPCSNLFARNCPRLAAYTLVVALALDHTDEKLAPTTEIAIIQAMPIESTFSFLVIKRNADIAIFRHQIVLENLVLQGVALQPWVPYLD